MLTVVHVGSCRDTLRYISSSFKVTVNPPIKHEIWQHYVFVFFVTRTSTASTFSSPFHLAADRKQNEQMSPSGCGDRRKKKYIYYKKTNEWLPIIYALIKTHTSDRQPTQKKREHNLAESIDGLLVFKSRCRRRHRTKVSGLIRLSPDHGKPSFLVGWRRPDQLRNSDFRTRWRRCLSI